MKHALIAALAVAVLVGCAAPPEETAGTNPEDALVLTTESGDFHQVVEGTTGTKELLVDVKGMTCGACAQSVGEAFASVPGVAEVTVTLETEQVEVRYDDTATDEATVLEAVEEKVSDYTFTKPGQATES